MGTDERALGEGQSQEQAQQQSVLINLNNSGDPEFERRILNELFSAGRQLGTLAKMVQVLLNAQRQWLPTDPTTSAAIGNFESMQRQINAQKKLRDAERILENLKQVKADDSAGRIALLNDLRTWLDTTTQNELSGAGETSPGIQQ